MDAHSNTLLKGLSEKQRTYAISRYENKKKSVFVAYILWFVFGCYYFYLNKPLLNILLWVTTPGLIFFFTIVGAPFLGLGWWLIDLFRIPGLVELRNRDLLIDCIKDAKVVYDK